MQQEDVSDQYGKEGFLSSSSLFPEVSKDLPLPQEIQSRKIPKQNIVLRLRDRETFFARPGTHFHVARQFFTNVFPNFTVTGVDKPPCFLRKFSPTGQHFIAFSPDQTSLEIYQFQGSGAVGDLLHNIKGDVLKSETLLYGNERVMSDVRSKLFDRFFVRKHTTVIGGNGEHLNRECSLFTDDGKFVVVGTASVLPEGQHPLASDMYRNNESVSGFRMHGEDFCLHIVELATGHLCDRRRFRGDKIFLSHNQGVYLYKSTMAVLSVQQQMIHIFQLKDDGTFVDVRKVGRFCYEDDELVFQQGQLGLPRQHAYKEQAINSLKHRILVHLYKKAVRSGEAYTLRRFYQYFDHFLGLRMWKMQLLDERHLLIKYASEDVVALRVQEPNSQPSFFVVYDIETTQVVAVYENTSEELLELFENFCDMFRNASLHCEAQFTCSSSSNEYARQLHTRYKQTIINAKFGGHLEATRRVLAHLPIPAQSFSSSPYLDLALFSYDDKWLSVMERPKSLGDHPIRFYARDSGLLRFKIFTGAVHRAPPTSRRLVAFTFHPFEPFAISVQKSNTDYMVNFHFRHRET
ncbi:hypothetical protein BaRGS_00011816 [Batillaria attramentaria]|uniref:DET1 n=1 Tax=Batillaria attramentaria TaxID=370345 RepID=A0ABD0LBZ7_9CAEN